MQPQSFDACAFFVALVVLAVALGRKSQEKQRVSDRRREREVTRTSERTVVERYYYNVPPPQPQAPPPPPQVVYVVVRPEELEDRRHQQQPSSAPPRPRVEVLEAERRKPAELSRLGEYRPQLPSPKKP